MIAVIQILTVLFCLGAVAYLRIPLLLSCAIIFIVLVVMSSIEQSSTALNTVLWLLFIPIASLFGIRQLRKQFISLPMLKFFRRAAPTMSQTEREALDAGTVGWDGELFSGWPDWNKLLATPAPRLTAEEQAFLDGPVNELCQQLDDWHITNEIADLPGEVWDYLKHNGFFGMIIPKSYGGLEFSALAHSAVVEKIASRSITAAVTVMVPNSLGPAKLLLHYGTDAQKDHYLPRLVRGEEIPCFALTSPEAGSDAGAMPDTGIVCHGSFQGEEIVGIRLNWRKRYITLGPVATVLGLAFKLYDPDHLLGEQSARGITLALIPSDTPGISIGRRHAPLNMAFQNGPNSGTDVFIPLDWIIGGVDRIGQGWRMLMESLADGRAISLPALSTGGSKLACRTVGAYARIRKQFRLPIGQFEGVEEALARMAGYTYMMDAARSYTAQAIDNGEKPSVASAIVKYHLTEHMRQTINDGMDIMGGKAICLGPQNLIGRLYQAIPISITVEGANILTRTMIIFGQGAIRCHPYVREELETLTIRDEQQALDQLDKLLMSHMGFTLCNLARSFALGLTNAYFVATPESDPVLSRYVQKLTRMSAAFALVADLSMLLLGGALKRREKISGRLADILGHLYLASCVLLHFKSQGTHDEDRVFLKWACDYSLNRVQEGFQGLFANYPSRIAGLLLRGIVFPLGARYDAPADELGHHVAALILQPSGARDRLTQDIFIPDSESEPLQQMEAALQEVVSAQILEKKLTAARAAGQLRNDHFDDLVAEALEKQIINDQEAECLRTARQKRKQIIEVDEFAADLRTR